MYSVNGKEAVIWGDQNKDGMDRNTLKIKKNVSYWT
jgi:hypothetical protein